MPILFKSLVDYSRGYIMTGEEEKTTPELESEDIDNAIRSIFEEFEARLAAIETRLEEQLAAIGERFSEHASGYEHKPIRREDNPPRERHWYFRRVND